MKNNLWLEALGDVEVADVMSEVQEDYCPGQRLIGMLDSVDDQEITLAVDQFLAAVEG